MTTLTEARKAQLRLNELAGHLDAGAALVLGTYLQQVGAYLESQVSESQEVAELRARLARAEGFVTSVIEISRRHGNKEQYVVDVNKLGQSPYDGLPRAIDFVGRYGRALDGLEKSPHEGDKPPKMPL